MPGEARSTQKIVFLWRFSPRRLSAEEIRDSMLAAAGVLNRRMGGPGFRLYRYLQDNVATYVPLDQHGSETWRRAVYHHHARASVIDLMSEFDCPDPRLRQPETLSHHHATPGTDIDESLLHPGHGPSHGLKARCHGR